jgi:trk system potassium uptake protein TrkA
MVEVTLPDGSPFAGRRVGDVDWPQDTVLVAIIREERPLAPTPDDAIEAGDELLFITTTEMEEKLQQLVAPGSRPRGEDDLL